MGFSRRVVFDSILELYRPCLPQIFICLRNLPAFIYNLQRFIEEMSVEDPFFVVKE